MVPSAELISSPPAGFSGFGEINFELSFSFSHSHTFEQSVSTGTTKSVEFPLSVPAHSTYIAKGIVSEAEMEIPYELVFDFGGPHRKLKGHWKGLACSKATYRVDKKEHPSPEPQPAEENDVEWLSLLNLTQYIIEFFLVSCPYDME